MAVAQSKIRRRENSCDGNTISLAYVHKIVGDQMNSYRNISLFTL